MCLLTVFSPDAVVDEKRLINAAENNPDGFGFAMLFDGHIARFRSMHFDEVADEFMRLRETYPDTWALFHHRFSTGGGETVENCHPFSWAHDDRLAVGHNGVLPIPAGKRKSDTRIWAENHMANLHPSVLDNAAWTAKTEKWLGSSKAVFLSAHPLTEYGVYILNEELGHWEDGVWWSNRSYEESRWRSPSYFAPLAVHGTSVSDDKDGKEWLTCGSCTGQWETDIAYETTDCPDCGFCWICDIPSDQCMCWDGNPSISEQKRQQEEAAFFVSAEENLRAIAKMSLGGTNGKEF
jgi:hypothetical protein